jgi:hypothetical protein
MRGVSPAGPWQEAPDNTVASGALFVVPMLAARCGRRWSTAHAPPLDSIPILVALTLGAAPLAAGATALALRLQRTLYSTPLRSSDKSGL